MFKYFGAKVLIFCVFCFFSVDFFNVTVKILIYINQKYWLKSNKKASLIVFFCQKYCIFVPRNNNNYGNEKKYCNNGGPRG